MYAPTSITVTGLTSGTTYTFVIEARNVIDYSVYSDEISILAAQIPDPPTDLVDVPTITLRDRIGTAWVAPVFDGGSPIHDYRLWHDNASGDNNFVVLAEGLDLSYTSLNLQQGNVYTFKVQARNDYGYSDFSNSVSILAA